MFPDSQIAQSFSCGATKCHYLVCFGIYPCFRVMLIEKICAFKYYTLSFDESLNQLNHKKQMDMIVRFGTAKAIKSQKDALIQSLWVMLQQQIC